MAQRRLCFIRGSCSPENKVMGYNGIMEKENGNYDLGFRV